MNLIEARKKNGIQQQVADYLGISPSYLPKDGGKPRNGYRQEDAKKAVAFL